MGPIEDFGFGGESIPMGLFSAGEAESEQPIQGEKLVISSRRMTSAVLEFQRSGEFNPERDALMLRAFLSTTLDPETWHKFVTDIIMTSPISHQVLQTLMTPAPTKAKIQLPIQKRKSKSRSPEPNEEEGE